MYIEEDPGGAPPVFHPFSAGASLGRIKRLQLSLHKPNLALSEVSHALGDLSLHPRASACCPGVGGEGSHLHLLSMGLGHRPLGELLNILNEGALFVYQSELCDLDLDDTLYWTFHGTRRPYTVLMHAFRGRGPLPA